MRHYAIIEGFVQSQRVYRSDKISEVKSYRDGFDMSKVVFNFSGIFLLLRYSRVRDFSETLFKKALVESGQNLTKVRIGFLQYEDDKCSWVLDVEPSEEGMRIVANADNGDGTHSKWTVI